MLFLEGETAPLQFVTESTISSICTLQRAVWTIPSRIEEGKPTSYVCSPARFYDRSPPNADVTGESYRVANKLDRKNSAQARARSLRATTQTS
jgi:hypothetical protein